MCRPSRCAHRREAYSLDGIETNETLKGKKLEQHVLRLQSRLIAAVETQYSHDCYDSGDDFQDGNPNVCEARAVRSLAVYPSRFGDDGCYPDDDTGWDELKHRIPSALFPVLAGYIIRGVLFMSYLEEGRTVTNKLTSFPCSLTEEVMEPTRLLNNVIAQ